MSQRPLDALMELHQALTELRGLEARLHGIPDWMQDLHEEHSGRKAQIEALEQAVAEARQERRSAETEAADWQDKLKHFQAQIGEVRTQREYGALLHEIDGVKARIKELEEKALAAMERQEQADNELQEARTPFAELDERYGAELAKWEQEKPGVAAEAESVRGRLEVLKERVPPRTLMMYERIYERCGGEAMAEVRQVDRGAKGPTMWHCSACHYRVRPQAVVAIRNEGSLNQCDSCKRFLYTSDSGA